MGSSVSVANGGILANLGEKGKRQLGSRIDLAGTSLRRYSSTRFLVVVEPLQSPSSLLPWAQRVVLVSAGAALLSLLALAGALAPDSRGFGTHERLGLPPCTFRELTGYRCPSCGMTTSWAHLVRGQVGKAFRDNAGGALLGLATGVLAPWALISGCRGRWLWRPLGERTVFIAVWWLVAVTLIDWSIRFFLAP